MRKINNAFRAMEGYQCFGCDPNNSHGLQLKFYEDGEYVCSEWNPCGHFEGYPNILHGGIQATLLDEIAAWTVYIKEKAACVTAKMNIKYKKAVFTNTGNLLIRGKVLETKRNLCTIETELLNSSQEICASAEVTYYLFPQGSSQSDMYFPDYESFFDE